ncbi:MAG: glucose-1-phosphate adenylyltransferase subunit GlgD [Erysipelotrichaceae bacterium]|nr:glucose-1-phosphate adenylyltransferase subunit GlgD [Erysipelotrichaceae bacterium]MDO5085215.1 glucose-1-phosphate adenylyltransferase subunit GlgD [Erysipelotrichaceae bacterium]
MCNALGIVSFGDTNVDVLGMSNYRPVAAINFLGRYRIIDFLLSNMTNSGISNIQVYIKNKPRSLIDHVKESNFNINSKRGKIHVLYGESQITQEIYNHDISSYMSNMEFIERSNKPYVIVAPSHMVYRIDFNDVLNKHIETGNDITLIYTSTDHAKEEFFMADIVNIDSNNRVTSFVKNRGKYKSRNISLECYVMSKRLFIEMVNKAANTSSLYWFKDIIAESCDELDIRGYQHKGYVACINSLPAYYRASMELRQYQYAKDLFKQDWPIHTKTNDSCPTLYDNGASVSNSIVANGCQIEGTVINSVIGRNVIIKKGAIVENCVILPNAYIGEDTKINTCVIDREAIVHHVKKLQGTLESPIYVKRRDRI